MQLRKQLQFLNKSQSEQGLTLMESLVAIVMIGIAGAALFPAVAITVATRVQNQRAELAFQVAEAEVNRVRLLMERGDLTATDLTAQLPPTDSNTNPRLVAAPNGTTSTAIYGQSSCQAITSATNWCVVQHPISGDRVLGIQTFRVNTRTDIQNNRPLSFTMGVRVYDINAISSGSLESPPTNSASLGLLSSTSRVETNGRRRPLIVLDVPIARSDFVGNNSTNAATQRTSSLRNFCEIERGRIGSGNCTQN